MSFILSKINQFVGIIGQFEEPNKVGIEAPKEVLMFNMCHTLIFFSIE